MSDVRRTRIGLGYALIAWWRGVLFRDADGHWRVTHQDMESIRKDWGL